MKLITRNILFLSITMLAIPMVGLFIQLFSTDPESIAFARSGSVLVMFTVLVVWSNHTNQRKISETKTKRQRQDEAKKDYPPDKFQEKISKPRQVDEQEGRPIRGGSNDDILQKLKENIDAEIELSEKERENISQSHQDEYSTGVIIDFNIKFAELAGGLSGTFIWGYGDWLGQSLIAWLKSCF